MLTKSRDFTKSLYLRWYHAFFNRITITCS